MNSGVSDQDLSFDTEEEARAAAAEIRNVDGKAAVIIDPNGRPLAVSSFQDVID